MSEIKINTVNLNIEILKLKILKKRIEDSNVKCPTVVGGGTSIQELENICNGYKLLHSKMLLLVSNTIAFMKNAGECYTDSDNMTAGIFNILQNIVKDISGDVAVVEKSSQEKSSISNNEVINNSTILSSNGAAMYNIPDYAKKNIGSDSNGIYGPYVYHSDGTIGSVCEWNIQGEQLSCTYYTLRKLNERGVGYPCIAGPGNGSDWYKNFDFSTELPRYSGNNALYDLSNGQLPQENIVVSFASNPSSDSSVKACGHVMLIDRIERDSSGEIWVTYSDNYPNITNLNGYNPTKTMTLSAFMTSYNSSNGVINGVVVIGATN